MPYAIGLLPDAQIEQPAANSRALLGRATNTNTNSIGVVGEGASAWRMNAWLRALVYGSKAPAASPARSRWMSIMWNGRG